MQLKYIHLVLILFCFKVSSQVKTDKAYYIFFDDNSKCQSGVKQFDKLTDKSTKKTDFIVRDCFTGALETFGLIGNLELMELDDNSLSEIKFYKIEELNEINMRERKAFFDKKVNRKTFKSTFVVNPIYIVKKEKGRIYRYKVDWTSRVLQTVFED
jgi:hypothetical protein